MIPIFKSRNYTVNPDEMIIRINGFNNSSERETVATAIAGEIQRINRKRKSDDKAKLEYIINKGWGLIKIWQATDKRSNT